MFLFFYLKNNFAFSVCVDENENYVDDWCLGHLLQGMCYRCVNKPKEAMESLLNAVNRSVFAPLSPQNEQFCSALSLAFQRKLGKQKHCLLGGVYIRDTEILLVF